MYWADWGNHPKIETAAMDGTMRETLVQDNIQWPTGNTHTNTHTFYRLIDSSILPQISGCVVLSFVSLNRLSLN